MVATTGEHGFGKGGASGRPLVSCVVIFLNAQRFIQEAIESVLAQTHRNWELLLVDDGSTDASTRIALRYAQEHPGRVRYLEHPGHENRGMSASRNLGIDRARGEHVAFLDADDVWLPRKLERQVEILELQPEAGMVYGSTQYWYSWTGDPADALHDSRDFVERRGVQPNTLVKPPALLATFLRDGGAVPCLCSVLVRREVVEDVGGFEEEFRGQYEDQAFYAKIGLKAPVFVEDGCWSKYRRHPDSSWYVVQRTGQHHSARLFFLNWLARHLSEQDVKDSEIWKLLQEDRRFVRARVLLQKRKWRQAIVCALVLLLHHPRMFFLRLFGKTLRTIRKALVL